MKITVIFLNNNKPRNITPIPYKLIQTTFNINKILHWGDHD